MRILVINGVNLNMLGSREPDLYGKQDFKYLKTFIKQSAKELGVKVDLFQSNYEGEIVEKIQKAPKKYDGIIINAGAYTHTSVAILDALKCADLLTVEVHITDIYSREEFRHHSYISLYASRVIAGKGIDGYRQALEYFASR